MADETTQPPDALQAATDMAVATQTAGVQLLGAGMIALVRMVPAGAAAMASAGALPSGEEIEEGFDNMPV